MVATIHYTIDEYFLANFKAFLVGVAITVSSLNIITWYRTFRIKTTFTSLLVLFTSIDIWFEAALQLFMRGGGADFADQIVTTVDSILWIFMLQGVAWLTRNRLMIFGGNSRVEKAFVLVSPILIGLAQIPDFVLYHTSLWGLTDFSIFFISAIVCTIAITLAEITSAMLIIKSMQEYTVTDEDKNVPLDKQAYRRSQHIVAAVAVATLLDVAIIVMCVVQNFGMSLVIKPVCYSIRISFLLSLFSLARRQVESNRAGTFPSDDTFGSNNTQASQGNDGSNERLTGRTQNQTMTRVEKQKNEAAILNPYGVPNGYGRDS